MRVIPLIVKKNGAVAVERKVGYVEVEFSKKG
jgi:hypothetical protein